LGRKWPTISGARAKFSSTESDRERAVGDVRTWSPKLGGGDLKVLKGRRNTLKRRAINSDQDCIEQARPIWHEKAEKQMETQSCNKKRDSTKEQETKGHQEGYGGPKDGRFVSRNSEPFRTSVVKRRESLLMPGRGRRQPFLSTQTARGTVSAGPQGGMSPCKDLLRVSKVMRTKDCQ